jgi:N12 class adenine-specific DNA methylase/SAM-dependent methyltransferase
LNDAMGEPTGEITLARRGLAALELLTSLPEDTTEVDGEQRQVLAGWGGWGPLAKALGPPGDTPWRDLRDRAQAALSWQALDTAKNACDTAFYTPPTVARAMWDLVAGLGFTGGRVLEPGCGSGRFITHTPPGLECEWTGIEADQVSAEIARLLHPDATVVHGRLEKTPLREGSFDLVIGNVPFSSQGVYDPNCPKMITSLHGYFLWRALHAVRPGGLVCTVTSRWTLDSEGPGERGELARLGALVGAIRLPDEALAPGGTRVVTDIVVFRRGPAGADWGWQGPATEPEGLDTTVSPYFQANPGMVCGVMVPRHGQRYGMTLGVVFAGESLAAALDGIVQHLAADALEAGLGWVPRREAPGPAPLAGLGFDPAAEGSFTLHPDGSVTQQRDGQHTRVRPDPELAALIRLRDAGVALFTAEAAQGTPLNTRNRIRQAAMRAYQEYTATYGCLGRSDLSERADPDQPGEVIIVRKRPPMGGFRADPDWPAVLALEVWDDDDQAGGPAPILSRPVNTRPPRKQHTDDPGEALLLCLDQAGQVDLEVLARILRTTPDTVPGLLGALIWRDPPGGEWVTADEYLSGNVRAKLAAAQAAGEGWEGNVAALEPVQPADLGPEDINVQLGVPWMPPGVVAEFVCHLLGFRHDRDWDGRSVTARYEPLTSTWEVRGSANARKSPAATSTWGTTRVNAVNLVEDACNGTTPVVYDIIEKVQIRNHEETTLAAQKIRDLHEKFAEWVWEDPARADQLARIYNDRFNNTKVRTFDGSFLTFPGLTSAFTPYPHQLDMVARNLFTPATLCGHVVGAGKTFSAVATALKLRELGFVTKPVMTVPNHLLEQTCAEARRYFPGMQILMVTLDDLNPQRRKYFAAKCAARDWDLVVMTHQQFMALPVDADTQEAYYADLLDQLDEAMNGDAATESRATAKMLARQRKKLLARLDALADTRRDGGLTFEQTGIDYVIADECHAFKNLEFSARAEGFNSAGSKRADDMLMKLTCLRRARPGGHVAMMMTGTPVSNALSELHVLFRYLAPHLLEEQGIVSFDAFAAQYIRYSTMTEVAPDGSGFRAHRRPRLFVNLPELRSLLWQFADIRGRADLNLDGPEVTVEHVVVDPPPEMGPFTAELVARADKIRAGQVKPHEDNMLKVCGDGRAAALWMSMVGIEASGPGKIERCAAGVASIYHQTAGLLYPDPAGNVLFDPAPGALQVVFCDQGTPDSWDYGVYDRLRDLLTEAGVPRGRIAFIHDAKTHPARAGLFSRCRAGDISVLIASTEKAGTGVNIQKRLVAIHHLNAPWRPADIEQRDGRGDRPGNLNDRLLVVRYATEKSFDSYMWQGLERKGRFIAQVLTGDPHVREAEAVDNPAVLSYQELKALSTGQPLLLMLSEVNSEVARLRVSAAGHRRSQSRMEADRRTLECTAEGYARSAANLQRIAANAAVTERVLTPDGRRASADGAEAAGELLGWLLTEARQTRAKQVTFGWRSVYVTVTLTYPKKGAPFLDGMIGHAFWEKNGHQHQFRITGHVWQAGGGAQVLAQVDTQIDEADKRAGEQLENAATATRRAADLIPYLGQAWPHEAELAGLLTRRAELEKEIDAQVQDSRPPQPAPQPV